MGFPEHDDDAAFVEVYSADYKGKPMKEIPYIFFGYGGYEEWESYYGHSGEDESTSEFENYPEDGFYIFCNNKQHFIDVYSKTCDVEVDAAKPLDRSYAIFAVSQNYLSFCTYPTCIQHFLGVKTNHKPRFSFVKGFYD